MAYFDQLCSSKEPILGLCWVYTGTMLVSMVYLGQLFGSKSNRCAFVAVCGHVGLIVGTFQWGLLLSFTIPFCFYFADSSASTRLSTI